MFVPSSLLTISRLVSSCGQQVCALVSRLVPALLGAAGELESARLSHLSTVLADSSTREVLDDLRANATKHHYTTDTVVKVGLEDVIILWLLLSRWV